MKYRYEIPESERRIFFNGVELKSPFSNVAPRATLELNDMMIVVYTDAKGVFGDELVTSNVCAYSPSGSILWVIQPATVFDAYDRMYFVGLAYDKKSKKLIGATDGGNEYEIDLKTGAISLSGFQSELWYNLIRQA